MPNEILQLRSANALIRSNKPEALPTDIIDRVMRENTEDNLEKFGLFDSGSPNYYTYYPDVKPEDLTPMEADFVYPVFRLLSKIVISPKRMAIDFTDGDVLKKSMSLLVGQTIFLDHESITGSAMGSIQSVYWQEEYKLGGVTIPAGINGVLKIDAKANPRIARLIMMDPPGVHSCSVTINFSWRPSHPQLSDDEFYNQLGTFDKKGERVRKIADDIKMYFELSLVPHGADPFAKKVVDGKLVMAKQANKIYQMSLSDSQIKSTPYLSPFLDGNLVPYQSEVLNFSTKSLFNTNQSIINNKDEMDFKELVTKLGLDPTVITNETELLAHFTDITSQVETLTQENTRLTGEVETLTNSIGDLNTRIDTLTNSQADDQTMVFATAGKASLALAVGEAEKFYRLCKGDKVDDAILQSIQKADLTGAQAFLNTFKQEYEEKVPLCCESCGSEKVSRKASKKPTSGSTLSNSEVREKIRERQARESVDNFLSK